VSQSHCQGRQRTAVFGGRLDDRRCVSAAAIEIARILTRGRFQLSAVSLGLGVVLPPEATFAMGRRHDLLADGTPLQTADTRGHDFWVEGLEPICAGLISGSALMGIGNAIINVLLN
jgi:uncharacterized oligopeptide transporter (OPT) family protein